MNQFKMCLAESGRIWRLTWPVFLAQVSQVGMAFTDTVMTGRASAADMAAVALAVSIWHPISLFGLGCLLAISPLTAQMVGAGNSLETPRLFRQGLWLTLFISVPLMVLLHLISLHLGLFGVEPHLAELGGGFLRAILWGLPGLLLFVTVRGIVEGHARTRPAMVIGIMGLLVLIPLNYVFIYGKLGMPAFGAIGCGIVTAVIFWLMALCMIWHVLHSGEFSKLKPFFSPLWKTAPGEKRFDLKIIKRILDIGLPGALAILFEVSLFALTAILLAPLGTSTVAGHQVALNFSGLLFMIPMSLGITATIRVGNSLGSGDYGSARTSALTALCLGMFAACFNAAWVVFFSREIALIYNDDPQVVALASQLLVMAAAFQFMDAIQVISIGILRGYNDTKIITAIAFTAYFVIGLPLGFALARTEAFGPPRGAVGFWVSYLVVLSLVAACFLWRLKRLHSLEPARIAAMIGR